MRRLVLALGLVALVAGSCGGGPSAADIVSQARGLAQQKASARLITTMTMSMGPQSPGVSSGQTEMRMEGLFDFANRRGLMTFKVTLPASAAGQAARQAATCEMAVDKTLAYVKVPPARTGDFGGKAWARVGIAQMSSGSSASFAPSEPAGYLDFLSGVTGEIKTIGTEKMRGVETTHYRATVTLEKFLAGVPEELRATYRGGLQQLGLEDLPMDTWIDKEGLPRKISMKVQGGGGMFEINAEASAELFDYGAQADTAVPQEGESFEVAKDKVQASLAGICFPVPSA